MATEPAIIRFSLGDVPERDRRATLTEVFGRGVVNMDFEPLDERPHFDFEIRQLPGIAIVRGHASSHIGTAGHDRSRENDDLMLAWATRPGKGRMLQRGMEIQGDDGTAAFVTCAEPMVGDTRSNFSFVNVRVARRLVASLLPNPEVRLMQPIPRSSEARRLLSSYLAVLREIGEPQCPEAAHVVSLHIADLVALAVGTTRDASEFASRRGLRAARAASVKAWLLNRVADPNLSISDVAAAHGISRRYVQMLFEHEGTSFTRWLRGKRLALAHRRLADPSLTHRSIACIAFDCGFSDLSWFNHSFRQVYGETPGDVRHRARFASDPSSS